MQTLTVSISPVMFVTSSPCKCCDFYDFFLCLPKFIIFCLFFAAVTNLCPPLNFFTPSPRQCTVNTCASMLGMILNWLWLYSSDYKVHLIYPSRRVARLSELVDRASILYLYWKCFSTNQRSVVKCCIFSLSALTRGLTELIENTCWESSSIMEWSVYIWLQL